MSHGGTHNPPSGYYFQPDNSDLYYYLKNKAWGLDVPIDAIQDLDLYSLNPDQLAIRKFREGWNNEAYYFAYLHREDADSTPDRSTSDGYWEEIGGDVAIISENDIIGYKNTFAFVFVKDSAGGEKDNYFMEEFRLNPSLSSDDPKIRNNIKNLVLCKVQRMPPKYFLVPEVEWVEGANECSDDEDETGRMISSKSV